MTLFVQAHSWLGTWCRFSICCAILLAGAASEAKAQGEAIRLSESYSDSRVFSNQSTIVTAGKVQAAKGNGEKEDFDLKADISFDYFSRRLPPSGRDADALRDIRYFQNANLATTVAGYETKVELPADRRLIVVNGSREGLISYCPDGLLNREAVDLLEIPGDALSLLSVLPLTEVRIGEEWSPADWVLQMLTGIEAVEKSELKCRLDSATPSAAKVTFTGKISGLKLGTTTTVSVVGVLLFNLEEKFLSQAKTVYTVTSDVGTVNPGLDMKVTTSLVRSVSKSVPQLSDEVLGRIPLDPAPESLALSYFAAPWGLELSHGRDWHLFQAVYDGGAPVAILRLVELGSLVAQCNFSPAPAAPGGNMTPLEVFEMDIQKSLGERFGEIVSRETIPLDDGRKFYRVAANGHVMFRSEKDRAEIPMTWIYYLVANKDGKQASFVFSVEPALLEQLGNRDRELVQSLKFHSSAKR